MTRELLSYIAAYVLYEAFMFAFRQKKSMHVINTLYWAPVIVATALGYHLGIGKYLILVFSLLGGYGLFLWLKHRYRKK